jgi:hypothetical protein
MNVDGTMGIAILMDDNEGNCNSDFDCNCNDGAIEMMAEMK